MTDTNKNCPHCSTHIDEHPASPCLNAWVAEDVMGWEATNDPLAKGYYSDSDDLIRTLYPSSYKEFAPAFDIAPAWEVVMYFKDRQYPVELTGEDAHSWSRWDFRIWHPLDDPDFKDEIARGWDESMDLNERIASASLAICRAAIKASPQKQTHIDPDPRLEEIAKAAAEINPDFTFADALEKHAKALDKTRDELDDTEKMQAVVNAVLAQGERSMTKSLSYTMYAAGTIKLVKATLQGTIKPLVPFSASPLEFCEKAHDVKDKLVSNAMELLENDIPIRKQGDGWISVEECLPEKEQKVLGWADGEIGFPFILEYEGNPTHIFVTGGKELITHWMPLPEPPTQENK